LFDLESDPGEKRDVSAQHQEIVQDMLKLAESARAELGDKLTGRTGSGVRAAGLAEK
jgi:arylsulfatase A